jgi:hypothetical protein
MEDRTMEVVITKANRNLRLAWEFISGDQWSGRKEFGPISEETAAFGVAGIRSYYNRVRTVESLGCMFRTELTVDHVHVIEDVKDVLAEIDEIGYAIVHTKYV